MTASIKFDRAADYYDDTRGLPSGDEQQVAALFSRAGNLTATSRVLEIGVGTGRIALPLSPYVRSITGVDLSIPMMDRLRAKRSAEAIVLAQADATRLPFAANAFDAAVAVHVFHLIPNWQAAVQEVARVLRPAAPLLSAWSEDFHKETWWDAWNAATASSARANRVGLSSDKQATFLEELGWQPEGGEYIHVYSRVKTPQQFLDHLAARIWSSTWELSEEELAAGIAAVRDAMLKEESDLSAPISISTRFHVRACLPPK